MVAFTNTNKQKVFSHFFVGSVSFLKSQTGIPKTTLKHTEILWTAAVIQHISRTNCFLSEYLSTVTPRDQLRMKCVYTLKKMPTLPEVRKCKGEWNGGKKPKQCYEEVQHTLHGLITFSTTAAGKIMKYII